MIGVAGDEPVPEGDHGRLHPTVVLVGVVVAQGASLIGKDVDVIVDHQAAARWLPGRGLTSGLRTCQGQRRRSGQELSSIQVVLHGFSPSG